MEEIIFEYEKETKGAVRFQEKETDQAPAIGSLYIKKWVWNQIGSPEAITVTIKSS